MNDDSIKEPVELFSGIFWVGSQRSQSGLNCNPYLLMQGDKVVLIDPGSVLDFEEVRENVASLIALDKITHIILHHQDPDLCGSVPLFEQAGFSGYVVTHWRTALLIRFYGISSKMYLVNENGFTLKLSVERVLNFIPAPYMHFPGAVMTYDPLSEILFSGDVFGAIDFNHHLWAGDDYEEAMLVFHENYMPSNEVIRPVMENLMTYSINMVAPQHGSIIKGSEKIQGYIKSLRNLECGVYLTSTKQNVLLKRPDRELCNRVLKRYYSILPAKEIQEAFEGENLYLDPETKELSVSETYKQDLWEDFFQIIYRKKGVSWLTLIESYVRKLTKHYNVELPEAFKTVIYKNERQIHEMSEKNKELRQQTILMQSQLDDISNQLMRCPITGLYNERFFIEFLQLKQIENNKDFTLLLIEVSNIMYINNKYDKKTGDEVISGTVYLINNFLKREDREWEYLLVKLNAPAFGLYLPFIDSQAVLKIAQAIIEQVSSAGIFIEPVTLSIGISSSRERPDAQAGAEPSAKELIRSTQLRVQAAKKTGGNSICDYPPEKNQYINRKKILLIEPDEVISAILREELVNRNFQVIATDQGDLALELIEKHEPQVILCELNTPQIGGYELKQILNSKARLAMVPFILLSSYKTEDAIIQANRLNIRHFFVKPFAMIELCGLVTNILKSDW